MRSNAPQRSYGNSARCHVLRIALLIRRPPQYPKSLALVAFFLEAFALLSRAPHLPQERDGRRSLPTPMTFLWKFNPSAKYLFNVTNRRIIPTPLPFKSVQLLGCPQMTQRRRFPYEPTGMLLGLGLYPPRVDRCPQEGVSIEDRARVEPPYHCDDAVAIALGYHHRGGLSPKQL